MLASFQLRLLLLSALSLLACGSGCATTATVSERTDLPINTGWTFIRKDVPEAKAPDFDDSKWEKVNIPHTWNIVDGEDGGSNYFRGKCWYRLHLPIQPSYGGKRLFLRFEAASMAADVFVNGQPAGTHLGGFQAFCFDITNLVKPGDNVVAVRVDNSPNPDLPPTSADFTFYGGIYRPVHLLVLNPVSISPTDDASPGVYIKPSAISDLAAKIQVTTKLRNDTDVEKNLTAVCTVLDANDREVTRGKTSVNIDAHSGNDAITPLEIKSPHLWNGRPDPYLYHVAVDLLLDGKVMDRVVQPLGLRTFRVDAQTGFYLNGKSYPLHGVGRHQDHFGMGWAIGPEQVDEDYRMIDELNCSAVRLAHYQHMDYEYSLCDREGIIVWAENALVNRITDTKAFADCTKQQLRELIKQNYNHPSIMMWALQNELGPSTRPDWSLINDLNDESHQLDPDRLTTTATHVAVSVPVAWIPDIVAFNRYFGWYTATIAAWPTELDKLHLYRPNSPIGISEYGAGASTAQHEDHPTTMASVMGKGPWHPEEWQSIVHEEAYNALKRRPWIWGTFIWVMFDFACDERAEGDVMGRNDKGLVTADRKVKKDAFYFYKANWSNEPFVHINSSRFNPRQVGHNELKVYSNCEEVELFLDGQSLGVRSNSDHIFIWSQVILKEGTVHARAVGWKDGKKYDDACVWRVSKTIATRPTTFPSTRPGSPTFPDP